MTPDPTTLPTEAETQALAARRSDFFRRLQLDRDFQLFFQVGVLDSLAEDCERTVKNRTTKGTDLEAARDKWLWALELRDLVQTEVTAADRLRAEEHARRTLEEKPPPRGADADN
jgi:hypothetical protein